MRDPSRKAIFGFGVCLTAFLAIHVASAAVPQIINYQGRLEDASGNLQGGSAGTNFDFKFSIWDDSVATSSANRLWPASAPASTTHKVTNGVFDARLGDTAQGFSAFNLDFNTSTILYLQVEVYNTSTAAFETFSTRQAIVSAGFAINADTVDGAHAGTSANNVLKLDPSGGINLPSGSSTLSGAVSLGSTLNVSGVSTLSGITFTNATGTGNLQIATLTATGASSFQGFTFTNATGTGNLQAATVNITGVSALQGMTFTNATGTGFLQVATATITGLANCNLDTNASGTITCGTDATGVAGSGTSTQLAYFTNSSTLSSSPNLIFSATSSVLSVSSTQVAGTGRLSFGGTLGTPINNYLKRGATATNIVMGVNNIDTYDFRTTYFGPISGQTPDLGASTIRWGKLWTQYVDAQFTIGVGSRQSGAAMLDFGENFSALQFANGALANYFLQSDLGGFTVAALTGLLTIETGFNTSVGGETLHAVEAYVLGSSATTLSAALGEIVGADVNVQPAFGAGSPALPDVYGIRVGALQTLGSTSTRSTGIALDYTPNGITNWGIRSANDVQVSASTSVIFGGDTTTKGNSFIRAKSSSASSTVVIGTDNIARFEFSSSSLQINGTATTTLRGNGATSTFGGALTVSSTLAVATSSQLSATSTLTVCAKSNCTVPTTASSTNTVAFFASTGGATTDTSIVARGVITSGLADIGEFVRVTGSESDYEAGDVLSVSVSEPGKFEKSAIAFDPKLAGIVTKTAGLVAGGGEDSRGNVIMALAGRLPIKVTGQNGPIQPGDYLTSSDTPGHAMKLSAGGPAVAIAMEGFFGGTAENTGQILAFVKPQWVSSQVSGQSFHGGVGNLAFQGERGSAAVQTVPLDPEMTYSFRELAARKLTIGSAEKPAGITLFDIKTRSPFCVQIEDGVLKTAAGRCGAEAFPPHENPPPDIPPEDPLPATPSPPPVADTPPGAESEAETPPPPADPPSPQESQEESAVD